VEQASCQETEPQHSPAGPSLLLPSFSISELLSYAPFRVKVGANYKDKKILPKNKQGMMMQAAKEKKRKKRSPNKSKPAQHKLAQLKYPSKKTRKNNPEKKKISPVLTCLCVSLRKSKLS
jgi:hypothetical protein